MAGYTRQSTFADGDTITAALFNNEYNQLLNAFNSLTGHKHDGTTGEGAVIALIGDTGVATPLNKVLIDTTNDHIEFWIDVSSASVQQLYIADGAIIPVTDSDIDLGTTSLRFKDTYTDTITTTGNVSIGGDLTVTGSATISGNLTFGDADTDSINLAAEINSDIIPNTDGTYDLGSATKEWQDLYIDGTANIDSLVADTADINGGTIDGATIATSDITVGAGKTLNVSAGTLTLADNQISGDKVEGGTIAATTITTLTSTTGNITNVNATTVDSTNLEVTNLKAKDGTSAGSIANTTGVVTLASSVLTTTDINGGTIDGATIGGTTAGAVTFTDLSDGTITIAGFADEDNMVSNSATLLPTQQSVKAYVDSQVTAQDLDFQGDTGGALSIDLDSESLTIAGGTGLDTVGSGNTVTVNIDSTVATLTGSQTLTNKTLTAPTLTGTAVVASLDISGDIDVDGTTNLDVVDIDGAVDMASTLGVTGVLTANAGVVVDNITIDGSEIQIVNNGILENLGDFHMHSVGDIRLYLDTNNNGADKFEVYGNVAEGTTTGALFTIQDTGAATFVAGVTASTFTAGTFTGTLATAAQPNITSVGTLTTLTVDDITINGSTISDAGDLTLDVGGDIILDSGGFDVKLKVDGTEYAKFSNYQNNFYLEPIAQDKDLIIRGNDGGSVITALTLDMSAAGAATFNSTARATGIGIGMNPIEMLDMTSSSGDARIRLDAPSGSDTEIKFFNATVSQYTIGHDDATDNFVIGTANVDSPLVTVNKSGVLTANAGVVVDNITIDGTQIDLSSGDLTLDVAGVIVLDADNAGVIQLKDAGSHYGSFFTSSDALNIQSNISDGDIIFKGNDGGSGITALTLDMSDAGTAIFNNNLVIPASIYHTGDTDTFFGFESADTITFNTNSSERLRLGTSEAVVNEGSADYDFRVESNGNSSMLFVDGGNDRVGFGTSGPLERLQGHNGSGDDGTYLRLSGGGSLNETYGGWMRGYGVSGSGGYLELGVVDAGTKTTAMQVTAQGNNLKFYTRGTERLQFDYLGNTVFNEGSNDSDFRVESNTNDHMLFVDGGNDKVRVGTAAGSQTDAPFNTRRNGSNIEFGHSNNGGGYYGTVGAWGSAGHPYIGLSTDGENSVNTFSTRGSKGNLIYSNTTSGDLVFAQLTTASATGQTPVARMTLDSSGNLLVGKTSTSFGTAGAALYASGDNDFVNDSNVISLNRLSTDGSIITFYKDSSSVGSIGVNSSTLQIGTGNTQLAFSDADDAFFVKNAAGANRDGSHDLGKSNVRFKDLYLSGGVVFDAVAGNATSNTLDDYEEGTWTPQIYYQNGTDQSNATNVTQTGYYTKIGRVVTLDFRLGWDITGTPVNDNIGVKNLPFVGDSNTYSSAGVGVPINNSTTINTLVMVRPVDGSTLTLCESGDMVGNLGNEFGTGTGKEIRGTITYFTDA